MRKLKNGLTPEQVGKAKELFKKVNLSEICRVNGVQYMTIANVLRDRNNDIASFNKVVIAAQKIVNEREKALETLPL